MKREIFNLTLSLFVVNSLMVLRCNMPSDPTAPEKTSMTVVFKTADSIVHKNSVTDTIRRQLNIGAALYLPKNFDSISLVVKEYDTVIIDTTFRTFKDEYFYDTVWCSYTFSTPGVKNLLLTPHSSPGLQPVSSNISIVTKPGINSSITFLKNSSAASGTMPVLNYTEGDSVMLLENAFINPGYSFSGWATTETEPIEFGDKAEFIMGIENIILYAIWVKVTAFTVTFNKNDDSAQGVMADQSFVSGISTALTANAFTNSGWTFAGWATSAEGTVVYTDKAEYTMEADDDTLYAIWTQEPLFKVTFNSNGGTGSMADQLIASGMSVPLSANTYAKTGFIFSGWNTASDGNGTSYADGISFAMDTLDVILYAQWNPDSYIVTYDDQGATTAPSPSSQTVTSPATTVGSLPTQPQKTGYSFGGWYTAIDGGGSQFTATTVVTANDTVYAKWTQNVTFTLTISASNGSVTKAPDLMEYDSGAVVMLTPVPSNDYHFTGWSGALTGTANPGTITMNEVKSVTANFEKNAANTYSLTVLSTNGTVTKTPDLPQYDSGSSVGLKATPGAGYKFINWTGDATGTADSVIVTMTSAKNVTANFALITYQLSILNDDNGTTTPASSATVNYGLATDISATPTAGYVFSSWTVTTGTATVANPTAASTTVTLSTNATIKANFSPITVSLTMSNDGHGTTNPATGSTTVNQVDATAIAATPSAGYVFSSWTVTTGTATVANPTAASTTVTLSTNATIKANFSPITVSLNMSNDGHGTTNPATGSTTVNLIDATTIAATPSAGYVFSNWTVTTGTATVANPTATSTTVTLSTNATIKANFSISAPTITSPLQNSSRPVNDSVTFTINASGSGLSYKWLENGVVINSATSASYTTSHLTTSDISTARTYRCVVSNTGGKDSCEATLTVATVTDNNSNIYHQLKIGTQVWMIENLKATRYNDGTEIPNVTDNDAWAALSTPGYCWYDNDISYKDTYGALYNWLAVNTGKLAPTGWHVPSHTEWTLLEEYLIAHGYNYDGTTEDNKIARSLASETEWIYISTLPNGPGSIGTGGSANNSSGFSGYPGGSRTVPEGSFKNLGITATWWTATRDYDRYMQSIDQNLSTYSDCDLGLGFSVRCVKD